MRAQTFEEWVLGLAGTTYVEDNGEGQMEKHDTSGVVTMVGGVGGSVGGGTDTSGGVTITQIALTDSLKRKVIEALVQDAWQTAEDHGFHEADRGFGEEIALMHSELSEALEDARANRPFDEISFPSGLEAGKVDGIAVEFADVIIRIFDVCGSRNIPLADALRLKMKYNKSRPYKHDKQF